MRTKGSARFEPYFKVQFYEERSFSWKDVQKAHATEKAAREHFVAGRRCRVMKITERGREPLPEEAAA